MKPRPSVVVFLLSILLGPAATGLAQPAIPAGAMSEKVLGDPEAQVTIIEYASLTCPHCANFHKETLPKVKAEYIDTGKAKLVYRDFPLDQLALKASLLARCAPEGRFFAFLDVLYSEQQRWARSADPAAALGKLGLLGGVGQEQFEACTSDEDLSNFVLQQRLDAQNEHSVESTPTFIINGTKLVGPQFAEFKAALDELLE